ncbi:MAG: hypothetical protein LBP64_00780 [Tannerella sp.]|jgi:hypothetical protein|nr:hypothetical protein [Tannerella sp.]
MKKLATYLLCAFTFGHALVAQVYVEGYYRKDGTYVRPHYRSSPNGSVYDNYSTKGNVNPYTGKKGTKNVYPRTSDSRATGNTGVVINDYYRYDDNSEVVTNDYYRYYDINDRTETEETYDAGRSQKTGTGKTESNNFSRHRPVSGSAVTMTYFEKTGSSFNEEFSLKNNSRTDISTIIVRIIYKLENGEIIDYRDYACNAVIPAGLSKKFTADSFDRHCTFVYKYGNDQFKDYYTQFTVEYSIISVR